VGRLREVSVVRQKGLMPTHWPREMPVVQRHRVVLLQQQGISLNLGLRPAVVRLRGVALVDLYLSMAADRPRPMAVVWRRERVGGHLVLISVTLCTATEAPYI